MPALGPALDTAEAALLALQAVLTDTEPALAGRGAEAAGEAALALAANWEVGHFSITL